MIRIISGNWFEPLLSSFKNEGDTFKNLPKVWTWSHRREYDDYANPSQFQFLAQTSGEAAATDPVRFGQKAPFKVP